MKKTILALALTALSAGAMAQASQNERELQELRDRQHQRNGANPTQPAQPHQVPQTQPRPRGPGDVMLNPQPLPPVDRPHVRDHRDNDRDHRDRDRDFRRDRDYQHWNDRDHRRNYEFHRDRTRELRIGMRKSEVLRLPWWQHPLYIRDNGPFDTYVYADGRHGRCVLNFQFNRLAEIHCD